MALDRDHVHSANPRAAWRQGRFARGDGITPARQPIGIDRSRSRLAGYLATRTAPTVVEGVFGIEVAAGSGRGYGLSNQYFSGLHRAACGRRHCGGETPDVPD